MTLPAFFCAVVVWLLIMILESLQGALRRLVGGIESPLWLQQVGVATGVLLIVAVTWGCFGWIRPRTPAAALAIGVLWVALTLGCEFALGRMLGLSWTRILADYDLSRGGLLGLGMLAMALTPWAVLRVRQARAG